MLTPGYADAAAVSFLRFSFFIVEIHFRAPDISLFRRFTLICRHAFAAAEILRFSPFFFFFFFFFAPATPPARRAVASASRRKPASPPSCFSI